MQPQPPLSPMRPTLSATLTYRQPMQLRAHLVASMGLLQDLLDDLCILGCLFVAVAVLLPASSHAAASLQGLQAGSRCIGQVRPLMGGGP